MLYIFLTKEVTSFFIAAILLYIYIYIYIFLTIPFFGREVKPSVPCRRFAACKITLNGIEKASFRQNYRTLFSPTVPPFATRSARVVGYVEVSGGESGKV
jgi:uncharacterized membrane protein